MKDLEAICSTGFVIFLIAIGGWLVLLLLMRLIHLMAQGFGRFV